MHQIRLARHADQRVGRYLAGFNDLEPMTLIKAPCSCVGGIVDQAQALDTQVAATLAGLLQKLLAQPKAAQS